MAFPVYSEDTIIKCTNPTCRGWFSVIVYGFADEDCLVIYNAKMIPLTGNTPYYCPCCGKNLGKASPKKI